MEPRLYIQYCPAYHLVRPMAALPSRRGHSILQLWLLSYFPRLFSVVADWMSTILSNMMWP